MSIDQQPLLLEPRNSYDQENSTSEERRTLRCSLFQFDGVKEAKSVAIVRDEYLSVQTWFQQPAVFIGTLTISYCFNDRPALRED